MIRKYYIAAQPWDSGGGEGGGDKPVAPTAPQNYKPLSPEERQQWNNFLNYVDKQGLSGSTKLDAKDQSVGLGLFKQYKKSNPDFSLNPDDVQRIQYDQYLLRKGDAYPGLTPEQLKYVRGGLNPAYMARPVSPVDNWLGSVTSKLYYPTAVGGSSTGEKWDFGTNFEAYAQTAGDNEARKKYLVKTQ